MLTKFAMGSATKYEDIDRHQYPLFRAFVPAAALYKACEDDSLILCDYVINELYDIIARKRPDLLADVDVFLAELQYESVLAPRAPNKLIADPKDAPVLNAAIVANVDIIITGDKHFLSLRMEHPKILTAAAYLHT